MGFASYLYRLLCYVTTSLTTWKLCFQLTVATRSYSECHRAYCIPCRKGWLRASSLNFLCKCQKYFLFSSLASSFLSKIQSSCVVTWKDAEVIQHNVSCLHVRAFIKKYHFFIERTHTWGTQVLTLCLNKANSQFSRFLRVLLNAGKIQSSVYCCVCPASDTCLTSSLSDAKSRWI